MERGVSYLDMEAEIGMILDEPNSAEGTVCLLCPRTLLSGDQVIWVPGVDAPAHEECLDREVARHAGSLPVAAVLGDVSLSA